MSFPAVCGATYLVRIGSFAVNGFGEATLEVACRDVLSGLPADRRYDLVAGGDIGRLLLSWGPCPGCPEDLTGDDVVDSGDWALLVQWGVCP